MICVDVCFGYACERHADNITADRDTDIAVSWRVTEGRKKMVKKKQKTLPCG